MSTGPDFDWFAASRFVPHTARAQVSEQLDHYVAEAARYLLDCRAEGVNLYLSGSLSRQEPSVTLGSDGRYRLHSDVDLVAVTDDELPADHGVFTLQEHLTHRFPDVEVTVLYVAASDLPRVGSLYGRDLWCGLDRPLVRSFDVRRPAPPDIGPRQQLEVLVHQLGACLLFDTAAGDADHSYLLRESSAVHLLKLALESLRCLLEPPPDGPLRYGDTYAYRDTPAIGRVMPGPNVGQLVRYRETHLPGASPDLDVYQCVITSLAVLFGAGEGPGALRQLVARIEALAADRTDVMNLFQCGLLLFLLAVRAPRPDDRLRAAEALYDIWSRTAATDLRSRAAVAESLLSTTPRDLAERDQHAMTAGQTALTDVRLDYYAALKDHNNGRHINPQYTALCSPHRNEPSSC
ncbi:hypothetical protein [Streptomyces sp. CT34]|uniref:hypothetical protein n=1 Tax=Streptomyces sp. CT34 TaxID=1553907 RepID=UPI0005BA1380|nr:hypothetical protein [Streptomyces sp. CT34]